VKKGKVDVQLLIVVGVLLAVGTIVLFSASAPTAYNETKDVFSYLKKHLIFLGVGLIVMFFASIISMKIIRKYSWLIYAIGVVGLLIVFSPLGIEVNGARRWVALGDFSFQPSEFMKIALVFFISKKMATLGEDLSKKMSYIFYGIVLALPAGILVFQHHLSAIGIILITAIVMLLIGEMKKRYFAAFAGVAALLATGFTLFSSFRYARLLTFLDPLNAANMQGTGWQIGNSLMAIGSGGLFGLGFGKSVHKFILPEPQNDFIFAILVEEMGLIGALIVLLLFGFLIYRGITAAIKAKDKFSSYVAIGITLVILIQVIMNILVVTSLMPVTGISLPFFSYGGTSLIILMGSMGILLNISRKDVKMDESIEGARSKKHESNHRRRRHSGTHLPRHSSGKKTY